MNSNERLNGERLGRAALGWQWRFANLPLGGGGLRAEAAALNNPAAGIKPAAGKAPRSGRASSGRERHALRGVMLPCAVLLTAHRLHPLRRSARPTARTWVSHSKKQPLVCMALVGWR